MKAAWRQGISLAHLLQATTPLGDHCSRKLHSHDDFNRPEPTIDPVVLEALCASMTPAELVSVWLGDAIEPASSSTPVAWRPRRFCCCALSQTDSSLTHPLALTAFQQATSLPSYDAALALLPWTQNVAATARVLRHLSVLDQTASAPWFHRLPPAFRSTAAIHPVLRSVLMESARPPFPDSVSWLDCSRVEDFSDMSGWDV